MRDLALFVSALVLFATGCATTDRPEVPADANVRAGGPIVYVESKDGRARQYLYPDKGQCGSVEGPYYQDKQYEAIRGNWNETQFFIRREDAIVWVEEFCANAKEVKQ
jgi:hypothetical protein